MIVTFYSFKGGVGRSMAVANVGDILARRGFRVLLVDFDLEAPGLEQYFQINQSAARRHEGLLDLLLTYKRSMSVASSGDDQFERVERFIVPVYERLPGGARLDLMPAGQREGREQLERYAANLRSFDWQDFYNRWEGELFFEWLRGALVPERYDLVVVDSRTGVTEMGGICTYQLADAIFMLSAANHQNRQGTLNVAADFQSLAVQTARRQRPLDILVVPARVEQRDPALAGPFLEHFEEVFAAYLPSRIRDAGLGFRELLIPYDPTYAFEERVISDPARTLDRRSIAGAFERLADAVCALVADNAPASELARKYTKRGEVPAAPSPAVQFDAAKRHAGYDVFLSYAAGDDASARELSGWLRQAGLVVFEDRVEIAPGEDWRARTGQALFHSRACLVCCGREGLTRFQANDLMAAVRGAAAVRELIVIPVLLRDSNIAAFRALAPPELQTRLPIDLQQGVDSDASVRQLELLVSSLRAAPAPTPAAPRSAESQASLSATTVFGAPYPGARPFGEADVQFFFGREETRAQLREALRREGVVVLTGPSASGKTSLVEAGLVPALRSEPTPLAYERLVPSNKPDEELRAALQRLQALTAGRKLLFLDQLERLLRLVSADRARAFLAQVAGIVADPAGPDVVIALRDVRLDSLAMLAPAGLLAGARRLPIPPFTEEDLRIAVLRPAELAGLAFEPGLVDRIMADWGQDQRFLPFLQRVLHDLWVRRREGFLTNDAYNAIPDPVEAIAEQAWATLDDGLKPLAERVLPRITTLCGNVATFDAGCRPEDLVLSGMQQVALRAVLWHMVDHGVLYAYAGANGEARVAPAFAVEQWDRAQGWVDEQAPLLEWLPTLEHHRLEWERARRDPNALLAGRILDQALEKSRISGADLSTAEADFIRLSDAHRARQRRVRYQVSALVALVILALIGAGWWVQRQEAAARASTRATVSVLLDEGDRTAAAGDRAAAVEAYSRAIELDADDPTALMRRAATLDSMGRYDEAIADLDRVIALTRARRVGETQALLTDAYLARGTVHLHRQNFNAALQDFDRALRLDDTNPVAHASRGSVLEQLKRDEEAARAYSRALELNPEFADAAFARGVLYQRQERFAQAATDFTRVSALPTASPSTQLAARSRLEQLGKAVTTSSQKTRVFLHIAAETDRDVAEQLSRAFDPEAFEVQGIELVRPSSRSDVCYYFREDERAAESVRLAAESLVAARGYNVRLESRFLTSKEPVKPGTVEVWLPRLAAQAIPTRQYALPSATRRK
jgi:tetratricopeptide (TPR) repeat protein